MAASSSPIQRTITSNDAFTVLQNVRLRGADPRVDQLVRFGDVGELRLSAAASTPAPSRRRIDFAFEAGEFTFKALPLRIPCARAAMCVRACGALGAALTWHARVAPATDPVPFKLLGDEAKGYEGRRAARAPVTAGASSFITNSQARRWLDTTYLSERVRISKGNKGTTFILRRVDA